MPNQTITVQFTVQNEDDFFGTLEDVMMSDQTGFSSYTVLSSSDIARDEYNRPSKSDLSAAYNRLLAEKDNECSLFLDDFNPASKEVLDAVNDIVRSIESNANKRIEKIIVTGANGVISPALSWRILYGEFLENEILSDKFSSFEDILFEIEGSHTPYCVMEFIEGVGWDCYQEFMGGEEIYYSSLFDQPE